ncbi:dynein intermediate chain CFAP94, axonemal isoform X1 [Pimephales promelas]|uniref:dynein intermediate chain CFAP94, axonemal isoform X1 n=1 Tax=Pimephales promelas TaxID=90988 RepID=UPI001955CDD6|nr:dynein intermediate chain CFAP94, axonemal isoform X1 [Pimephales promelas]KAG1953377.1 protein CASC1 [Pimephales promelas]
MSAKKKGGKNRKAERERLQREADEQRLREEEEARLIAEREENERLERERIEQEKQQLLELKDRERREDELNELRHILDENHSAVTVWESECRDKSKWERYMRCDGSPDPAVQPEINTFISLWREDSETQISKVLENCALALQLIDELDLLLSEGPEPYTAQQYRETVLCLQDLNLYKLNQATEELLKFANSSCDIETGNMQTVVQNDNISLCLWANLNKNPRFKGYRFEEVGLGFELPKPLAVSDIAVRILHTRYDHLSHHSEREQVQRRRSMMEGFLTLPSENTAVVEDGKIEGEEDEGESSKQVEEESHSVGSESRKRSAVSVVSTKEGRKSSSIKLLEEGESQMEGIAKSLEADQNCSDPSTAELEFDSADIHIVDLQQFTPLGGVFYFDVFHLPPQSYIVRGWEMRELLETGLQVSPYPTEQSRVQSSTSVKLDEHSSTVVSLPVGVTVALPDSIIFLESPQVARWNPLCQHWRTDCISETNYDAEARSISFQMNAFHAFTLLQESYANMPFQSWELRPLGQDSALFTITGALTEVSITVKGKQCMLQMEEKKYLDKLLGKWMSPSELQKAMRRAGINIFVNEYSDKYVSINSKDPLIEHTVYEQMALMSSAVAFSWSRWNTQCGQEHLVLQACEQLEAVPVTEEMWSLYLLGAQRNQHLKMKEDDNSFSAELSEGSEFHSTFLHMLRQDMSIEGQARVSQSHYLYVDTIQRLLCATRVLTYS